VSQIVYSFVQALRDKPEKITLAPATGADRFSSRTATWLFLRDPAQLTAEKQAEVELICQRSETARKAYALTQQFMTMLRLRHGQDFETWLSAVEASQIPELHRFAQGLLKDKEAVVAGLTLSYSNGPVEAQGKTTQIGQAIDVWSCQTSSATTTLAAGRLILTDTFPVHLSFSVRAVTFSSRVTSRPLKPVHTLLFFVVSSKQAHFIW
jgi:Transposase